MEKVIPVIIGIPYRSGRFTKNINPQDIIDVIRTKSSVPTEILLNFFSAKSDTSLYTPIEKSIIKIIMPNTVGKGAFSISLNGRYIKRSGTIPK